MENLNIVILGSGNVATHLSKALDKNGFTIKQIYSRTAEHASQLATQLQCQQTTSLDNLVSDADMYIFSLSDSVYQSHSEVYRFLTKRKLWGKLLVHTAGSVSIDIFSDFSDRFGVFYPLQTFSKSQDISFDNIPVCIEANTTADLHILEKMGKKLTDNVLFITSEQRKLIHVAAVFACNFTNHFYTLANEILKEKNVDFDILRPLIQETAQKVQTMPPEKAQTGPAVRFDKNIIKKHLNLLSFSSKLKKMYSFVSESIYDYHKKNKQTS